MKILKKKELIFVFLFASFIMFYSVQDAYAVTVYPGTIIANPIANYTANVKPNFNVTKINTNATDIFLGSTYYDLSWVGHKINANITGFNEGNNASFQITSPSTSGVTMTISGHLEQVKLNNANIPYGSSWTYNFCKPNLQCTQINVGTSTNIFLNFGSGIIQTSNFIISGYMLSGSAIINSPSISLINPATANVTALLLWNTNGQLVSFQNFNTPIPLTANLLINLNTILQDNSNPTGSQTYYEEVILQSGSSISFVNSNQITLNFGSFTNGNLNFNQTNTNTVPIYFIRNDLNKTDTRLSVIYPSTFNLKCNLGYTFAFTNKTYGPPLANIPYQGSNVNSSFKFHNVQNEIVNVICTDTITNSTGRYVLTQNNFPFQQQIASFRAGAFGTQGNFGVFDFVSLGVVLISMIGFNRKNEAVGAFFSISIIGAAAYFGIVTLPTFIIGAVIVAGLLAYTTTKKQSEVL